MTSAAYKAAGMGRRSAERQGYGLVVFAAILLAVVAAHLPPPPEHRSRRLMREAAILAPVGRTHGA